MKFYSLAQKSKEYGEESNMIVFADTVQWCSHCEDWGPQNEIHTGSKYFPCPYKRGNAFYGFPCFHLSSLFLVPSLLRPRGQQHCCHRYTWQEMSNSGHSHLSYSFSTNSKQHSTLVNDLDTSLGEICGTWFKRQTLREVPPAMSGDSKVAIVTDGN